MGNRITNLQGKSTRPGVYKCKDCRKPFSVTVGTVMERSHIPPSKWLLAAQLMASSKKSISAHQLHRLLGTSYEAAWFLFHRIREAANDIDGSDPIGGEGKVFEADKSYIGGKAISSSVSRTYYCQAQSSRRGGCGGLFNPCGVQVGLAPSLLGGECPVHVSRAVGSAGDF
jgi:transposase-like protein